MRAGVKRADPFRYIVVGMLPFVFISCWLSAMVSSKKIPAQKTQLAGATPQEIFATCASYAQGLVPDERAFLMVRIAYVASSHHFPQSEQWARQAFIDSSDLPESWNKIALQKSALTALADTQPMDALRLLGTLAAPKPNDKGARIPEDVRTEAARVIFPKAYSQDPEKSVLPMLEVSAYLGRTGEYPYEAWAILLPKIAKDHPGTLDEAVSTAIRFYGSGEARTRSHDEMYFDMVNEIRTAADPSQMKLAVATGIDYLQAEKPQKNDTYISVVGNGAQRTGFDDRTKDLLYRWLPLVKAYDSAEYDDFARKLNAAGPPPKSSKHAQVEILTTPDKMTPTLQQWAQDSLQEQNLINDASSDPDRAIQESTMIHSMALRSDALAKGAMTISAKQMPQRTQLLAESRRDLNQVHTKNSDYLRATADLADAYAKSKMQQSALALVHDGLEQGTEVLDESADAQPNTPTMVLDGYDSLAKLVGIGMKLDPAFTLKHVQNLRDLPLKVNLLVDVADALATQQSA
jgi:hypothetical protein